MQPPRHKNQRGFTNHWEYNSHNMTQKNFASMRINIDAKPISVITIQETRLTNRFLFWDNDAGLASVVFWAFLGPRKQFPLFSHVILK